MFHINDNNYNACLYILILIMRCLSLDRIYMYICIWYVCMYVVCMYVYEYVCIN